MIGPIEIMTMARQNTKNVEIEAEFPQLKITYDPQHEFQLSEKPF
jgi:hypothetical protein